MDERFDAVVIGAGAAGLFCAGVAGQLGLKVLVLDHSPRVAEKIRISGGGRCNFTNRDASTAPFLSANPSFCRSALARYGAQDFIALVQRHGIAYHEKHRGQLFCDRSAQDIIDLLLAECAAGGVQRWQPCRVHGLRSTADGGYAIDCAQGPVHTRAVVVATGGLSVPAIGASDAGYRVAQQFGLNLVPTRPGLVPLGFEPAAWQAFASLAGLSLPVEIATGSGKTKGVFAEDLLFTHRGLSGPAVLQISSYWREGQSLNIDLAPGQDLHALLVQAKAHSRRHVAKELARLLPARLADTWVQQQPDWQGAVNQAADKALSQLARSLHQWSLAPTRTEGYKKAEVTLGGVDTRELSSQTMESRQAGLYFIGEVVDVSGWLGGYNFQWAWSSGYACAQALAAQRSA